MNNPNALTLDAVITQLSAGPLDLEKLSTILRRNRELVQRRLDDLITSGRVSYDGKLFSLRAKSKAAAAPETSVAGGSYVPTVRSDLQGYDSSFRSFREICMLSRNR